MKIAKIFLQDDLKYQLIKTESHSRIDEENNIIPLCSVSASPFTSFSFILLPSFFFYFLCQFFTGSSVWNEMLSGEYHLRRLLWHLRCSTGILFVYLKVVKMQLRTSAFGKVLCVWVQLFFLSRLVSALFYFNVIWKEYFSYYSCILTWRI